jgi:hypothetical protein
MKSRRIRSLPRIPGKSRSRARARPAAPALPLSESPRRALPRLASPCAGFLLLHTARAQPVAEPFPVHHKHPVFNRMPRTLKGSPEVSQNQEFATHPGSRGVPPVRQGRHAYCFVAVASTVNNPGSDGFPVTGEMFCPASAASCITGAAGCEVSFE